MDDVTEKDAKASAIIYDHIRRPYYRTDVEKQAEWHRLPKIPSGEENLHSIPDHHTKMQCQSHERIKPPISARNTGCCGKMQSVL